MKNIVNCAVIGVGKLGGIHARNLVYKVPTAKLKTVVASRMSSAEKTARELGVENWTDNVKEVLEDETIDAVIIATPSTTHADLIIQASKHNKQIFVDKPITETIAEAEEVIKEINQSKVICQVGFMRRFDPSYADAKERIDRGDIGEPIYYKGISRDPGSPPEKFIKDSGGIFIDYCIHEFDISRYLIGSEVKSVKSSGGILLHPFMEKYNDVDQSMSLVEFENGVAADIEVSRNSPYGIDVRGEIIGTEGMIHIGSIQSGRNRVMTKNKTYYENLDDFPNKFKDAFLIEIEHFIDSVRNKTKPIVTEVDGKKALEISEAALKSFNLNKKIYL